MKFNLIPEKALISIIISFIVISSCSKSTEPIAALNASRFEFVLYDGLTQGNILQVSQELERNYIRILSDLQVDNMPVVTVKIWANYSHFLDVMESDIGIRYIGATGYVYGMTEFRIFFNSRSNSEAIHEFVHLVSMQINSSIPNNPRWLWEAVALYENNEFFDPVTLPYMVSGNYPTLDELNSDFNTGDRQIYSVGYILLEYIISSWEMEKVIELIYTNGNIPYTLGITVTEFESGWYQFIREKYFTS
jgi:hypothetical protein